MLEATLNTLREHDFVRGEEQVNRKAMAKKLAVVLAEHPVQLDDEAELSAKALLVPELSYKLFGELDDEEVAAELEELIRQLVPLGGAVQEELEDGHVLCSKWITRSYSGDHGPFKIRKPGRFVSSNVDVVEHYYAQPALDRMVSAGASAQARFELGARRVPELANRRQELVAKAYAEARLALPEVTGGENTP